MLLARAGMMAACLKLTRSMSPRPDPRITWIVGYMHREIARPLNVQELARLINLSPSRFGALFAAQTGASPLRYLQRLRLRRARLLVERTFLSIKEVMALVGYNDPSHFARDFRREHGASPSACRKHATMPADRRTASSVNPPTHRRIGLLLHRDPRGRCA
jgi:transcriptional regulator GlxA family with amidase domain